MTRRYKKILGAVLILAAVTVLSLALLLSHNSPCGAAQPLLANSQAMQAAVYRCYGVPEVVKVEAVAKPTLEDDSVLVKVRAASINPLDWHYIRGEPYLMRTSTGIGKPDDTRLGVDFAGVVEAVGKNVRRFKPGDEVFGGRNGSLGQYVSVRENDALELKPANVTFEQAAAVPVAALTALQALRDQGKIQPGAGPCARQGGRDYGVMCLLSKGADRSYSRAICKTVRSSPGAPMNCRPSGNSLGS